MDEAWSSELARVAKRSFSRFLLVVLTSSPFFLLTFLSFDVRIIQRI